METKYLVWKLGKIEITKGSDGLWRDGWDTVYAFPDGKSVDKMVRCGVGLLSLPEGVGNCGPHDFAYSSPYYQLAHTREEADEMLRRLNPGLLGRFFYWASRLFGGRFWENNETR